MIFKCFFIFGRHDSYIALMLLKMIIINMFFDGVNIYLPDLYIIHE